MEAQFEDSDQDWMDKWDKTQQVNLRSMALISKWAINAWKERRIEGRIINIASRAGVRGDTGEYAAYAASKAGMIAFTKSIARSLGNEGITAYSIAPGFVNTDMDTLVLGSFVISKADNPELKKLAETKNYLEKFIFCIK